MDTGRLGLTMSDSFEQLTDRLSYAETNHSLSLTTCDSDAKCVQVVRGAWLSYQLRSVNETLNLRK